MSFFPVGGASSAEFLIVSNDTFTFDLAVETCARFDAEVGFINNQQEFDFLRSLAVNVIEAEALTGIILTMGYINDPHVGEAVTPLDYIPVNPIANTSFYDAQPGTFPWVEDALVGSRPIGNDNVDRSCLYSLNNRIDVFNNGELTGSFEAAGEWIEIDCSAEQSLFCRREVKIQNNNEGRLEDIGDTLMFAVLGSAVLLFLVITLFIGNLRYQKKIERLLEIEILRKESEYNTTLAVPVNVPGGFIGNQPPFPQYSNTVSPYKYSY